jgi:hypothetical protein
MSELVRIRVEETKNRNMGNERKILAHMVWIAIVITEMHPALL